MTKKKRRKKRKQNVKNRKVFQQNDTGKNQIKMTNKE